MHGSTHSEQCFYNAWELSCTRAPKKQVVLRALCPVEFDNDSNTCLIFRTFLIRVYYALSTSAARQAYNSPQTHHNWCIYCRHGCSVRRPDKHTWRTYIVSKSISVLCLLCTHAFTTWRVIWIFFGLLLAPSLQGIFVWDGSKTQTMSFRCVVTRFDAVFHLFSVDRWRPRSLMAPS